MKLLFTFLVSILLIEEPPLDQIYQHPLLVKADSLKDKREYDQAFTIYRKAAGEFTKNDNPERLSATYNLIGGLHSYLSNFDSASYYLNLSLSKYKKQQINHPKLLSDLYYRKGVFFDYTYQPDSALYYHHLSLDIRSKEYGDSSPKVALVQKAIADVYKWVLQDYYNAEAFYLKTLKAQENADSLDYYELAKTFYSLATTYRSKGEHEKAITYGLQALNNFKLNYTGDSANIAACQGVLANAYFQTTQFDKAVPSYQHAIQLAQGRPYFLADFYINLGAAYTEKTQYNSARSVLQKSLKAINELAPIDSLKLAKAYQQIGTTYIETDLDSALKYYDISIETQPNNYNHRLTVLVDKAKLYNNFHVYDELTQNADSALFIISKHEELESSRDHIYALGLKAWGLQKKYKQKKNYDLLYQAYEHYQKVDDIISSKRDIFSRERDKLNLADSYRPFYEQALSCVHELMQIAPHDSLQRTFLRIMEKNKAQILFEKMQKYAEYSTSNILQEDSLFLESKAIESRLNFLNAKMESIKDVNSKEELNSLQQAIYKNESNLESIQTQLSARYPKLLNQKNISEINVCAIKASLKDTKTDILEYFWGDSAIYIYHYNSTTDVDSTIKLNEINSIQESIDKLLNLISSEIDFNKLDQDYRNFVDHAYYLYSKLIPSQISNTENRNLLIITDRKLAYLPFEALITEKSESMSVDYRSPDYFLKSKNIQYAFSANLLLQAYQKINSERKYKSEIAIFSESSLKDVQSTSSTIRGTGVEAGAIGNLFQSTTFSGNKATKSNFLEYGSKAELLHIALHGSTNPDNPLMGGLSFRSENDSLSILYYYELMNLNFDAELTVLSACETGIGEFFDGEGVYNIARAFHYAGCQSIVSTLWKIDDRQSARLIETFYKQFKQNHNTATSLSNAKIQYLQESDEILAHPRYWAGFVLHGKNTKLIPKQNSFISIFLVSIFFATLSLFLIRRRANFL